MLEVASAAVLEKPCMHRWELQGSKQQHNEMDSQWKPQKKKYCFTRGTQFKCSFPAF